VKVVEVEVMWPIRCKTRFFNVLVFSWQNDVGPSALLQVVTALRKKMSDARENLQAVAQSVQSLRRVVVGQILSG